uniref:hypothetical protein n=1 Tax=Streptomyces sp. SAT1 TaxID=1849967 RepID=UPI0007F9BF30|nr:hypothetical protein [Streptomyces sp. SAT1]ANO42779.1 hypothetical protein A8713_036655 [Streptomyces sp. SAT1]
MKPTPTPQLLTTAFYAFYDLHQPAYHAYAAARLPQEEALVSVTQLFALVADNWATIVTKARPSAWAWEKHTGTIARRCGRVATPAEDALLLHDELMLSVDRIATVTGTEPATVTVLLAAARRGRSRRSAAAGLARTAQRQCRGRASGSGSARCLH